MKYRVRYAKRIKRDLKLVEKQGKDLNKFKALVDILANGLRVPDEYLDHPLKGDYKGCRECHIEPDWLLIYRIEVDILILTLTRTGSHSDLF